MKDWEKEWLKESLWGFRLIGIFSFFLVALFFVLDKTGVLDFLSKLLN